jgi:hypothetical protein
MHTEVLIFPFKSGLVAGTEGRVGSESAENEHNSLTGFDSGDSSFRSFVSYVLHRFAGLWASRLETSSRSMRRTPDSGLFSCDGQDIFVGVSLSFIRFSGQVDSVRLPWQSISILSFTRPGQLSTKGTCGVLAALECPGEASFLTTDITDTEGEKYPIPSSLSLFLFKFDGSLAQFSFDRSENLELFSSKKAILDLTEIETLSTAESTFLTSCNFESISQQATHSRNCRLLFKFFFSVCIFYT